MSESTIESRRGVAARLRRVIHLFVAAELDPATLAGLDHELEALEAKLEAAPRLARDVGGLVTAASRGDERPSSPIERDPMVGRANPIAPPMVRLSETGSEWGVNFDVGFEGHPGLVHGGFVSAVMDNALATAAATHDSAAMTGTLETRFIQPTPAGTDLVCRAEVERSEGRKHFVQGELLAGDRVVAEARGVFLHVDPDRHRS